MELCHDRDPLALLSARPTCYSILTTSTIAPGRASSPPSGSRRSDMTHVKDQNVESSENHRNLDIIFVLGGPGAGKGTQCAKLAKYLPSCEHLSLGDLLRAEISRPESPYGIKIAQNMSQGRIGPIDITAKILRNAIDYGCSHNGTSLFLLDGKSLA